MKLSFTSGTYETYPIQIEEIAERLANFGYDGIEIGACTGIPRRHAFPDDLDQSARRTLRDTMKSCELEVPALHRAHNLPGLSLIDPDGRVRKNAIIHTLKLLDLARDIDAKLIVFGLRNQPRTGDPFLTWVPIEGTRQWLVQGLKECGKHATDVGVMIAIEPINRFLVPTVFTVEQALELMNEVSLDSVRVMCDTYSMNIEERNMEDAVLKAGRNLIHVHFADNNRQAPGHGHIQFDRIVDCLRKIDYKGFISMEVDPIPDADTAARDSIAYLRKIGVT